MPFIPIEFLRPFPHPRRLILFEDQSSPDVAPPDHYADQDHQELPIY